MQKLNERNTNVNIKLCSLIDMLGYRRPAWSRTENEFISRFIDSVSGMQSDSFGNRFLQIGYGETMISCHTNSVHTDSGRQRVQFNATKGVVSLAPEIHSKRYGKRFMARLGAKKPYYRNCLGTDDASGVWLALQMIAAKVPALYVFHRAEEIGGLGSEFISMKTPWLVDGIERCIALDRRGQSDIITHQMMGRCASNDFAEALGDLLYMGHKPCAFGTFTDSANYTDLIPECTNVSVGYGLEHTAREYQDTDYLLRLCDALCHVDLESLPSVRNPYASDKYDFSNDVLDVEFTPCNDVLESTDTGKQFISTGYGLTVLETCVDCGADLTIKEQYDNGLLCDDCVNFGKSLRAYAMNV